MSSSDSMPAEPKHEESGHRTVLLHEAIDYLALRPSDVVVDGTLGGAGHSRAILDSLDARGTLVGFDADQDAITRAENVLSGAKAPVHLVHGNFRTIAREASNLGITHIDKALFDLGWSSYQLSAGRGFSFQSDEPLSMAYDQSQKLTAHTVINDWSEESLADVIFGWGEERYSRRIAKAIVDARPISTARELGEIIRAAYPARDRRGRIHPATKTFQAIRIAVNDELGALEEALSDTWTLLSPGGRIAVISFHSIEDRIVKHRFASWEKAGSGERVTRKPVTPSATELGENPRARSAKLRVIQKL